MATNTIATVVEWDENYSLGLPEIDQQHRALFGMINDLWQAIITRQSGAAVASVLTRLEHYSVRHFTAEETLMRSIAYPKFGEHRRAHLEFIRRIGLEREKQAAGNPIGLEILDFLNNWLVDHIMTADMSYAEHYERLTKRRPFPAELFSFGSE
jgi:hemerythrin